MGWAEAQLGWVAWNDPVSLGAATWESPELLTALTNKVIYCSGFGFFSVNDYKKLVGVDNFSLNLEKQFLCFLACIWSSFFFSLCLFRKSLPGQWGEAWVSLFPWLGGDHWQVLLVKPSLSYILLEEMTTLNIIPGANPLHLDSNLQKLQDNPLIKKPLAAVILHRPWHKGLFFLLSSFQIVSCKTPQR